MQSIEDAFDALTGYLAKSRFNPRRIEGRTAFEAESEDDFSPLKYYFQLVEQRQFLFYIQPIITLLDEQMAPVAEFIARANFGMRIGNFELDFRLRRPCFRSGLNFAGAELSTSLIAGAIEPAIEAYAEFVPGLARVIAGLDTPKGAIQAIEYGE